MSDLTWVSQIIIGLLIIGGKALDWIAQKKFAREYVRKDVLAEMIAHVHFRLNELEIKKKAPSK